ncbi:MAG TPA: chloride channel protein [Myxococcota bacterium]|nr:chloride channel protein [Myxococcota bacterium]
MSASHSPALDRLSEGLRRRLPVGDDPRFLAASCAIGVLTGGAAILFAELIRLVQGIAIDVPDLALYQIPTLPVWRVLLVPAAGGLLVGLVTRYLAAEAHGHGVPAVMEAVALRGGRIRRRVAFVKSLASALTIGTGGSVGREGPIVQIGASVGSAVGQSLGMPADRLRTLTAAGAAGGIAAAFNAPIAGAFFALEVIARNFALPTFGPVVLCAVFATAVSRIYFGPAPAFLVPEFGAGAMWETALAVLLGLGCGLVSLFFITVLERLEHVCERIPLPAVLKPAVGGLGVGALILLSPALYGTGYETMDATLGGTLTWEQLALLLLLKPFATSLTLASGGSGGVFLPSLYIGGLAGGLFGYGVLHFLPAAGTSPGAWALVGMAGVLAGTSFAPITAIILAFELTHDYALVLPIMVASAVSTLIARSVRRDSIYTRKLSERGIDLDRRDDLALRGVRIAEVMQTEPPAVSVSAPLDVVLARFLDSDLGAVFVTDAHGRLVGQVSLHDVKTALTEQGTLGGIVVAGDVSEAAASARPDDNLAAAIDRMSHENREVIGVVDAEGRLAGALSLRSIADVFAREALRGEYVGIRTHDGDALASKEALRLAGGVEVRTFPVPESFVGSSVRSLEVRSRWRVSVIALRRDGIDVGVDPDRPFERGDAIVVMGVDRDLARFADGTRGAAAAPTARA